MKDLFSILRAIFEGIFSKKGGTPPRTPKPPVSPLPPEINVPDVTDLIEVDFDQLDAKVYNRGRPPKEFLLKLIEWAKQADDEIFSLTYKGEERDIYRELINQRPDLKDSDRVALMCEVLRVMAGFEAAWQWEEGRDVTNSTSNRPETEEAGIFQVSANSMYFSSTLTDCFVRYGGASSRDYRTFRRLMKEIPNFAFEYTARLLRFTIRHHGPVKRGEIFQWISTDAVDEFERVLATTGSVIPSSPVLPEKPTHSLQLPEWYRLAQREIGQTEIKGRRHNPNIIDYWDDAELGFDDDETPWCAGFVGAMLERAGINGTGSGMARSYEHWGQKLRAPTLGCVVTFWRGSKQSGSGHVAFFAGFDSKGNIMCLGGNQSDAVNIKPFSDSRITGYYWPESVSIPAIRNQPILRSDGKLSTNES
tara:strand:- start:16903 stop:18162 length:1260 start_codon:yes stop_codon:yes gene_type:complete